MSPYRRTWWVAALLLSFFLGFVANSADALETCRVIKEGSSADALGEEFPERIGGFNAEGLGEEFPELVHIYLFAAALGEEFPELVVILGAELDALGEEFPE